MQEFKKKGKLQQSEIDLKRKRKKGNLRILGFICLGFKDKGKGGLGDLWGFYKCIQDRNVIYQFYVQ